LRTGSYWSRPVYWGSSLCAGSRGSSRQQSCRYAWCLDQPGTCLPCSRPVCSCHKDGEYHVSPRSCLSIQREDVGFDPVFVHLLPFVCEETNQVHLVLKTFSWIQDLSWAKAVYFVDKKILILYTLWNHQCSTRIVCGDSTTTQILKSSCTWHAHIMRLSSGKNASRCCYMLYTLHPPITPYVLMPPLPCKNSPPPPLRRQSALLRRWVLHWCLVSPMWAGYQWCAWLFAVCASC